MYMREKNACPPGNGPPHTSAPRLGPMNGIESATPFPIASPIPLQEVVDERVAEVSLEQGGLRIVMPIQ